MQVPNMNTIFNPFTPNPAVHISLVFEAWDNLRNCGRLEIYLCGPRDIPRRTQSVKHHTDS